MIHSVNDFVRSPFRSHWLQAVGVFRYYYPFLMEISAIYHLVQGSFDSFAMQGTSEGILQATIYTRILDCRSLSTLLTTMKLSNRLCGLRSRKQTAIVITASPTRRLPVIGARRFPPASAPAQPGGPVPPGSPGSAPAAGRSPLSCLCGALSPAPQAHTPIQIQDILPIPAAAVSWQPMGPTPNIVQLHRYRRTVNALGKTPTRARSTTWN